MSIHIFPNTVKSFLGATGIWIPIYVFYISAMGAYLKNREKIRVEARSLFCCWAVRELGYGLSELSRRLSMSQPDVGYAVSRGERIAKHNRYQLLG